MISRNSIRFKFIALLTVMTMVFSMSAPMGAWAVGGLLEHDVTGNDHTFTQLQEGYSAGDITPLSVNVTVTTGSHTNVTATLEGTNADSFEFNSGTTTASMGEVSVTTPAAFTVKPKTTLTQGSYQATVRIASDGDGTGVTFNITQVVTTPPAASYALTLQGDNISSNPVAGSITEGTSVTITVAPATGKKVSTFTVGGVDKKAELLQAPVNQYTFNMPSSNTTVAVTYMNSDDIIDISEANVLLVGDYVFTLTNPNEAIYNLNNYIHAAQTVRNEGTDNAPEYHIYLHVGSGVWYDLVTNPDLDQSKKLTETEINAIQSKTGMAGKYKYIDMQMINPT